MSTEDNDEGVLTAIFVEGSLKSSLQDIIHKREKNMNSEFTLFKLVAIII